jgi:hypothetical protein
MYRLPSPSDSRPPVDMATFRSHAATHKTLPLKFRVKPAPALYWPQIQADSSPIRKSEVLLPLANWDSTPLVAVRTSLRNVT